MPSKKSAPGAASKPVKKAARKAAKKTAPRGLNPKPAKKAASKPAKKTASKPAKKAARKAAPKPANKAARKAAPKPAKKTARKAAPKEPQRRAAGEPVGKADNKPASRARKSVKKPAARPVKKPSSRTALKPADKPSVGAEQKPASRKTATSSKLVHEAVKRAKVARAADTDSFTISATPLKKGQVGGRLEMSKKVVAVIANYTARRVAGIHDLGKAGLLYRSIGSDPTRGVDAEVGEEQAALDLEVIIEYGCDINETIAELRRQIAQEVQRTASREVVEINIKVTGIHLDE